MDPRACDRWEECQARDKEMKHMLEKVADEKREDHRELWAAIKETNKQVGSLAASMEGLTGKFVGYMAAGTLAIGIVTFIAAKVFH